MKNITRFSSFNEAENNQSSSREKDLADLIEKNRKRINPRYLYVLDDMISAAESKGKVDPLDLLTIVETFAMLLKEPEEILSVVSILANKYPGFLEGGESIGKSITRRPSERLQLITKPLIQMLKDKRKENISYDLNF
jgi:hypothetical protein